MKLCQGHGRLSFSTRLGYYCAQCVGMNYERLAREADARKKELICSACDIELTPATVCYLNDNPKSDDPLCSKCCREAHDSHEYERRDPAGVR